MALQRNVDTVHPVAVVPFGSVSRGSATAGSDLDLLVLEDLSPASGRTRRQELQRLRQALWDLPVSIDLLVYTPQEFAQWRDSRTHVLGRCAREGRVVYGQV